MTTNSSPRSVRRSKRSGNGPGPESSQAGSWGREPAPISLPEEGCRRPGSRVRRWASSRETGDPQLFRVVDVGEDSSFCQRLSRGVVVTSDAEEEELDTGQGSAFRDGLHQRATDAAPVIRVHDLDGDIRALGVRGIPDPATGYPRPCRPQTRRTPRSDPLPARSTARPSTRVRRGNGALNLRKRDWAESRSKTSINGPTSPAQ